MLEPTPAGAATPVADTTPTPAPAADTANPSGQEITPPENTPEVTPTDVPPEAEAPEEVDPADFLKSLFGIDSPETPAAPSKEEPSAPKDAFDNPNNEPAIFQKQIETLKSEAATKDEKLQAADKLQAIIDADPILQAVVKAGLAGKKVNMSEGFKAYAKSLVGPTPKTEGARPSGTAPASEDNLQSIISKSRTGRPMEPTKS